MRSRLKIKVGGAVGLVATVGRVEEVGEVLVIVMMLV